VQDTFRGRVCECPLVDGVQFKGDGYKNCEGKLYVFFFPFINQHKHVKCNNIAVHSFSKAWMSC
jgi:hypothetical protein